MESRSVEDIPSGDGWQYEPKWDGFRCLAFRDAGEVHLQSKSGQPLGRYFPELVQAILSVPAARFVLDGEIVVPVKGRLSFDDLLMRIHPAESRIRKLSAEHPAMFIVFDLLADEQGAPLLDLPLAERRGRLDAFARRRFKSNRMIRLSPAATDEFTARGWFKAASGNLDGVIAKRLDMPYRSGERDAMVKVKHRRTCDCVVGGFRYSEKQKFVGSLLLGLYNSQGLLDHIGFTSSFNAMQRAAITKIVERMIKPPGFTGRAPGGPSRWSTKRSSEWEPLDARLVAEVEYDHFTGGRFRHGTRFVRWRPDKSPRRCTMDQVERRAGASLRLLETPRRNQS